MRPEKEVSVTSATAEGVPEASATGRLIWFWFTAFVTVLYISVLIIRFFFGDRSGMAAVVQPVLKDSYLWILGAYVAMVQVARIGQRCSNGNCKESLPGEWFFLGWVATFSIMLVFSSIRFWGIGDPKILDEIWPMPFQYVAGFFGINYAIKTVPSPTSIFGGAKTPVPLPVPPSSVPPATAQ